MKTVIRQLSYIIAAAFITALVLGPSSKLLEILGNADDTDAALSELAIDGYSKRSNREAAFMSDVFVSPDIVSVPFVMRAVRMPEISIVAETFLIKIASHSTRAPPLA